MKDKEKIKNEGDNFNQKKDSINPDISKVRAYCNTPHPSQSPQAAPHRFHNRRSIRLKNYDYSKAGLYFITLCTANRENIFGEILNKKMHLNSFGKIATEEWEKTPEIRKNISLDEYIIMPNHFHAIISIDYKIKEEGKEKIGKFQSPSQTIGAIIRGFKGATTKKINNLIREIRNNQGSTGVLQYAPTNAPSGINLSGEGSIWQRNYYEHIIKTEKAYNNISNYIINNPLNWDIDKLK
ncbi:transposase [Marinifilum sp.]|uniref:transposase n=1 Tax=Marinifilum sp. TaxID=2033137 RepID=UPI003BA9B3A5